MSRKKINNFIGILLILLGITLPLNKYIYKCYFKFQDNKKIENYFDQFKKDVDDNIVSNNEVQEKNFNDYIGILEIPKISLKKGFVSKYSHYNNVDKNIQILKESDMPDVNNGNFILASHSGSSAVSFFKNLYKLSVNDKANIYFKNNIYVYKLVNIYEIEKNGYASITRNSKKSTLTLITCKKKSNKQIIFIFELEKIL